MARFPGVKQIPRGIVDVALVNLTQPGGKLSGLVPLELGDLLVDRQARLLNHVQGVDSGRRTVVEHAFGQAPEVAAVLFEQLAQSCLVAALRPLDQLRIDGVGIHVASAAATGVKWSFALIETKKSPADICDSGPNACPIPVAIALSK